VFVLAAVRRLGFVITYVIILHMVINFCYIIIVLNYHVDWFGNFHRHLLTPDVSKETDRQTGGHVIAQSPLLSEVGAFK